MYYKFNISDYQQQLDYLNSEWLKEFKANNPTDRITERYTNGETLNDFGYIVKDATTEKYITIYETIVNKIAIDWHENTVIQIKISLVNNLKMISSYPELAVYIKENNIKTYIEADYVYIYVNELFDEHKQLLLAFNAEINNKN
jgi:hypothetical protein